MAASAGSGAAGAAGALGSAAAGAGSALASGAGALGSGLASGASAIGSGLGSAASGLGSALHGLFSGGGGGGAGATGELPSGVTAVGPSTALTPAESSLMLPATAHPWSAVGGALPGGTASPAATFGAQGAGAAGTSPSLMNSLIGQLAGQGGGQGAPGYKDPNAENPINKAAGLIQGISSLFSPKPMPALAEPPPLNLRRPGMMEDDSLDMSRLSYLRALSQQM